MFGLFKRRSDHLDRLQAVIELSAEFIQLKRDTPAAAWFFARNLHTQTLWEMEATADEKLVYIDTELNSEATSNAARVDGGMSIFALRFLRAGVSAMKRGENELAFSSTILTIAKAGERYRELRKSDRETPSDPQQRDLLRLQNCSCLHDLLAKVELEEAASKEINNQLFLQCRDTFVASFDIKLEASSGRLWPHVQRMTDIISRM